MSARGGRGYGRVVRLVLKPEPVRAVLDRTMSNMHDAYEAELARYQRAERRAQLVGWLVAGGIVAAFVLSAVLAWQP